MANNRKSDLQKFIDIYGGCSKLFTTKRALFKAKNLDVQVPNAKSLIAREKLNLTVIVNADLASFNAFEVWEDVI